MNSYLNNFHRNKMNSVNSTSVHLAADNDPNNRMIQSRSSLPLASGQ